MGSILQIKGDHMTVKEAKMVIEAHKKHNGSTSNVREFLEALSVAGNILPAKATIEDYYKWAESKDNE